jgi:hypothetical protein
MHREQQEAQAIQITEFVIDCARFAQKLRAESLPDLELDRLIRHVFRIRRSIKRAIDYDSLELSDRFRSLDRDLQEGIAEVVRRNTKITDEEIRSAILQVLASE